jgi:hypothetical protein
VWIIKRQLERISAPRQAAILFGLAINTTAPQPARLRFSIGVTGRVWPGPSGNDFPKKGNLFPYPLLATAGFN